MPVRCRVFCFACKRNAQKFFVFSQKRLDKHPPVCYNIRVLKRALHAALAQLDRVTGYEPVGRGFESLTPYQKIPNASVFGIFCILLFTFHTSRKTGFGILGR